MAGDAHDGLANRQKKVDHDAQQRHPIGAALVLEDLARIDEGGAVLGHALPQSLDFGHDADDFAADGIHESEDRGGDGEYADVGTGQTTIAQQGWSQDGNGGEGYPCRSAGDEAEKFASPCRRWRRLDGLAAAIFGMIMAVMMMMAVAVTKVHGHPTAGTS